MVCSDRVEKEKRQSLKLISVNFLYRLIHISHDQYCIWLIEKIRTGHGQGSVERRTGRGRPTESWWRPYILFGNVFELRNRKLEEEIEVYYNKTYGNGQPVNVA